MRRLSTSCFSLLGLLTGYGSAPSSPPPPAPLLSKPPAEQPKTLKTQEEEHVADTTPLDIVFVLTDDLGVGGVGYNNPVLKAANATPTLDALAGAGITLDTHYTYKYCSPSRGSLLSGRYPWRLGASACNAAPVSLAEPLMKMKMLPARLRAKRYQSMQVGKWHEGEATDAFTPVGRGFDQSLGFLGGGEDHNTSGAPNHVDLSYGWPNGTQTPAFGMPYTYTGHIFSEAAVRFITGADRLRPIFLFAALHNTHEPFEAPWEYRAPFPDFHDDPPNGCHCPEGEKPYCHCGARHGQCQSRKCMQQTWTGMVYFVDQTVLNITRALKRSGRWNRTVLVWTTDNGSPVECGGSNALLRGGKETNFEGGVRTPAFISGGFGPAVAPGMGGRVLTGIVHLCDWLPTFLHAAGIEPTLEPDSPTPLDGVSQWEYLMGTTTIAPRTEVVFDHRMFGKRDPESLGHRRCSGCQPRESSTMSQGALRVGDFKIIVGVEQHDGHYGYFSPNATQAPRYIPLDRPMAEVIAPMRHDLCSTVVDVGCSNAADAWYRPGHRSPTVTSAADCCAKCKGTKNCTAWTWNGPKGNLGCSGFTRCNHTARAGGWHTQLTGSKTPVPNPRPNPPPPPPLECPECPPGMRQCASEAECFGGDAYSCSIDKPCLFDLRSDPGEHNDLSTAMPQKTKEMLARFRAYDRSYHPPTQDVGHRGSTACVVNATDGPNGQLMHWVMPCK